MLSGYNLTLAEDQTSLPQALTSIWPRESNGTRELKLQLSPFRDSYQTSVFFTTRLAIVLSLKELGISKRERKRGTSEHEAERPEDEARRRETYDGLRRQLVDIATPRVFEVGRS